MQVFVQEIFTTKAANQSDLSILATCPSVSRTEKEQTETMSDVQVSCASRLSTRCMCKFEVSWLCVMRITPTSQLMEWSTHRRQQQISI